MTDRDARLIPDLPPDELRGFLAALRERIVRLNELIPSPFENLEFDCQKMREARSTLAAMDQHAGEPIATICSIADHLLDITLERGSALPSQIQCLRDLIDILNSMALYISLHLDGIAIPETLASTIEINLQTLQARLHGADREHHQTQRLERAADPAAEEPPLEILLVDDEKLIRAYLSDILEEGGHHVQVADNGLKAKELIDAHQFDLIFTDIKMPGADGIEVLRHARSVSDHIEVVIVTGYATVENAAKAIHYGAFDYLTKPFRGPEEIQTLIRRIGQSLRLRRENRRLVLELSARNRELKSYVHSLEQALESVEEKQRQLVHADRMASLGILAAGVAHEINNPTTFIRGNLQTLQKFWDILQPLVQKRLAEPEPPPGLAFLAGEMPTVVQDMLLGTERITRIVSGLRTFAHPGSKEERRPGDLQECIRDALTLLHSQIKNRVRVETDLLDDPPQVLMAQQQITQVFVNLFMNAVQAMESTSDPALTVRSALGNDPEGKTVLMIEVVDNGPGISAENLDRIFNPFFTTKQVGEGTGLGLSIIHGIVQEHGGEVEAENRSDGTGAVFRLRLPVADPAEAPAPGASRAIRRRSDSTLPLVLAIDDEPIILRIVNQTLEDHGGYRVQTAPGGFQAIYQMTEEPPDLVILDVRMPDMDGIQVLEEMREREALKEVPVLCLTGLHPPALEKRLEPFPVAGIIHKPFVPDELLDAVGGILRPETSPSEPA